MKKESELDDFVQDKNKYIARMRNDKTYGSGNEIHIFSTMCGIQIKYFVRIINSSKCLKKKR